tara:strand:- start:38169 stop:39761 length:1593 start_codon:yes stop_codon:yes gene_type:complete
LKPDWQNRLPELGWAGYMLGLLLALIPFLGGSFEEMGDIALIARQVHMAAEWDVLRGAYSRLGFFHIGPVSFYWMALVDYILPSAWFAEYSHYYQFSIAIWIANLGMGLAAFHSARKLELSLLTRILILLLTIAFTWHLGGHVLFSPWGPHLTIMPVLWFSMNLVRSGNGDFRALPGLAFAAIWILHSHAGSLIFLGPSLIFLIYLGYKLYRQEKLLTPGLTIPLIVGIVILLAGLSLPIIEAYQNDGGNLKAIMDYLSQNSTWRKPGKALVFMLSAMDGPFRMGFPLFSIISLGLYVWTGRKNLGPIEKQLLAISLILLAGSFYGALRTPGVLVPHLFDHLLTINALMLAINLRPVRDKIQPRLLSLLPANRLSDHNGGLSTNKGPGPFKTSGLLGQGWIAALLLLFSLLAGTARETSPPDSGFRPSGLLKLLEEKTDFSPNPDSIYRIALEKKHLAHWPGAAGLMLQMERRGLKACIEPPYQILFGPEALCEGQSNGTILIEPLPENPKMKHDNAVFYRNIQVQFRAD